MLYKNRDRFNALSLKIGKTFARFGFSPNQWTLISIIFAFITAFFIYKEMFVIAAFFFIITGFFDFIDGSVARATNKATKQGAYLDTIVDRYVEFLIILPMFFISLPSYILIAQLWIMIFLFGSMMTTYSKAAAKEKMLVTKELKGGILERSERLILLFFGILFASVSKMNLTYVIIILAILSNITALQRIYAALKGRNA